MKMKKITAAILSTTLIASALTMGGCTKKSASDGKVQISIGGWPTETNKATLENYEKSKKDFEKKYPNIEIIPDTSDTSVKSYTVKASSGQLPNLYQSSYTEVPLVAKNGFAADITQWCDKFDYTSSINPLLLDKVSYKGKIYGVPLSAYAIGLACNRQMFEKAQLINEDGSLQFPQTYDELAVAAQKIKEATGQSGFAFTSMNNQGGWIFTCVAWSYGVKFMEQAKNGKWKASFNTPECVEALQYIKDLKWKYDVLPDNAFIDVNEQRKLFAANQTGMYLIHAPERMLVMQYSMNKDDICYGRIPAGPNGRYSLMGGNVQLVAPSSTKEQIDGVFKWLDFTGKSPNVSEESKKSSEISLKSDFDNNIPVMRVNPFSIWINKERVAVQAEIRSKYTNVPDTNFSDYSGFEDVIIQQEEPTEAQELYSILDAGIQEVITNKDADCAAIVKRMANDFQKNHLDKLD